MERKTVVERLEEVKEELGLSWKEMAKRTNLNRQTFYYLHRTCNEDTVRLSTVEKIGYGLGRIPVAFFTNNREIETLGIDGFLHGEEVDNYFGRVLQKHRELAGLGQGEFAENIIFVDRTCICSYERGRRSPLIGTIKIISQTLELVPYYLLPTVDTLFRNIEENIRPSLETLSAYLISSPGIVLGQDNPEKRRRLVELYMLSKVFG